MTAALQLSAALVAEMRSHAMADAPNEACGLLAADPGSGRLTGFHPARNAAASPFAFDVHPDDLVRIVHAIEASGGVLGAIFHSHPRTPAVPSRADVRDARYPVPYLVCSLADPSLPLRAWDLADGDLRELPLLIG